MSARTPAQLLEHLFRLTLEDINPRSATRESLSEVPPGFERPALIAVGKGAVAMARGVADACDISQGIVLCPVAPAGQQQLPRVRYFETDHPVPAARNVEASRALRDFAHALRDSDSCIAAISGGGSAQVCLPIEPLTLDDIADATNALLRSGLAIEEINTVRIQLDQLKGGRLADLIAPARLLTLVIVDVPTGDPAFVSSGPTILRDTDPARALELARTAGLGTAAPRVLEALEQGAANPDLPVFARHAPSEVRVVFDNALARSAIADHAAAHDLDARVMPDLITGPADEKGRALARAALATTARIDRPTLLIWGGETTVTVPDASIPGGRCQHMALAAAVELEGAAGITFAALGTDGVDGTTNACGAIVTGATAARARSHGYDPATTLHARRAHELLGTLDCLVRTGPTGTNVNELYLALVQPVR